MTCLAVVETSLHVFLIALVGAAVGLLVLGGLIFVVVAVADAMMHPRSGGRLR